MAVTKDEVKHVAHLARLEFQENELDGFTQTFNNILDYIAKLGEVKTEGIEPTSHVIDVKNVFRDDNPTGSLPNQEALSNAPSSEDGSFVVPRII